MSRLAASVAAALFLATAAVAAEDAPPPASDTVSTQSWSLVSAQTVGENHNFIHVEAGYPAIVGTFLHGGSNTFDYGGKFGFFYGTEGFGINPGLRAQGVLRWLLGTQGNLKFGLSVEPGIFTAFGFFATQFGVTVPVRFTVGIPITNALTLHAGADLPFLLNFVNGVYASIPILVGGGLEYFLNDNLSLTLRLRFGPSINVGTPFAGIFGGGVAAGTWVGFGFDTSIGVAFRI